VIFRAAAKVTGFAQGSTLPARWVALTVLFCVTAPCERAYAMNGLPASSQPKFVQAVFPQWWSLTAPDGEEFELPSGTKTCSRLKVRFVGKITMVAARVGPTYPWGVSFHVEDNFGDQQYRSGKVIESRFYHRGAVAELVGIEVGVVSGVINLESSGVEASDWRLRHEATYHEA
jgi:hypothetical protein